MPQPDPQQTAAARYEELLGELLRRREGEGDLPQEVEDRFTDALDLLWQDLMAEERTSLEAEETRQVRRRLATSGPLKPGEVEAALRETRELLARYEHAARADPLSPPEEAPCPKSDVNS